MIAIALMMVAANPTAEAVQLGRELAEAGVFAALLPAVKERETEELIAAHPKLSAPEKEALRASAYRTFDKGRERVMAGLATAYAERLTIEDLRALVAFDKSPVAQRYRLVAPEATLVTMKALGPMNFKDDAIANYCKETGKLCSPK